MKVAIIAATATALLAIPSIGFAQCGSVSASTSTVTCENGVRVVRHTYAPLPSIDPQVAARNTLERERLALQRQKLAQQAAQDERRAQQDDARIRNQSYLYRDANSPLRQRTRPLGYGTRGYRSTQTVIVTGR